MRGEERVILRIWGCARATQGMVRNVHTLGNSTRRTVTDGSARVPEPSIHFFISLERSKTSPPSSSILGPEGFPSGQSGGAPVGQRRSLCADRGARSCFSGSRLHRRGRRARLIWIQDLR